MKFINVFVKSICDEVESVRVMLHFSIETS